MYTQEGAAVAWCEALKPALLCEGVRGAWMRACTRVHTYGNLGVQGVCGGVHGTMHFCICITCSKRQRRRAEMFQVMLRFAKWVAALGAPLTFEDM